MEENGRKVKNSKYPLGVNDPLKGESKDKVSALMKNMQLFS